MLVSKTDEFINEYKKLVPFYEDFAKEVIFSIQELSSKEKLTFADIKSRVKTPESVKEKISRQFIKDPGKEIFDFVGVRIICLFEKEINQFAKLIEDHFKVTWKQNKKEGLGSNIMGYQSSHYSIQFGANFQGPRYNKFDDLICEVQITTVLMDAWGLINHNLVYKNEKSIPIPIQRQLNNVASLLEIAQGVFNDSDEKRIKYLKELTSSNQNSILEQPINYETLKLYSEEYFPNKTISPYWQNALINDIGKLKNSSYNVINDIHKKVIQAEKFINYYKEKNPELFKYSTDILTKSLGSTDIEFRKNHIWSSQM